MKGPNIERRHICGNDEEDALTGWRHWYCYLERAGAASKIKRRARRRERHSARVEIERERAIDE